MLVVFGWGGSKQNLFLIFTRFRVLIGIICLEKSILLVLSLIV